MYVAKVISTVSYCHNEYFHIATCALQVNWAAIWIAMRTLVVDRLASLLSKTL